LCIVEDQETALVTGSTMPEEFMRRGDNRLISLDPTAEDQLRWLALDLIQRGDLDGRTVGVAAPDTPGEFEPIEAGLVDVLEANGVEVAVFDQIGCQGGSFCNVGMQETVQRMLASGVDVVFNLLNAVSLPGFVTEMVNQGFEPGDVQFYGSEFNSSGVEIVASKVVAFGGEASGRLYDGTIVQSVLDTGSYRFDDYQLRPFNEMCNDTYGANSASGANHESEERVTGVEAYGMVGLVCEVMRMSLRAIYDAGDNPTRADIYATLASLGPVDSLDMIPASIRPGKTATPDAIHYLRFEYPCEQRAPFGVENICVYPISDYRPPPR
ncbi:MAG: ABC transporter substrate-binding protein, partial [Acidimicrobiaceae bacterium]|nr:ABC transporter substrate-binding protein [Acidimicrobiaceae bacterium]